MPTYLLLIVIFSIIGVLNTLYLSYHVITKTPVKCFFFPDEWCKTVQYSSYSKTLGIPNAFAGLVIYAAILILALIFAGGSLATFTPILVVITIGFLFSLYFLYIQAFVLKAYCTWCFVSLVDFTVMFIAALVR